MIQLKGREIANVLLDEIGRTPTYGLDDQTGGEDQQDGPVPGL
jgi:hypothetical protein